METQEILLECVLVGSLLERTDQDFNLNQSRLINSDPTRVKENVTNLIRNKHMDSIEISNIMIRMLVSDIEELYRYASEVDRKKSNYVWKQYRLSISKEIHSINNSNLLNFRILGFKQYTSKAIFDFQKIIATDKNSAGYKRITSSKYEMYLSGFKKYFNGMNVAMKFFLKQKENAEKKESTISLDKVKVESNISIKNNLSNISTNMIVILILYIIMVTLLKKIGLTTKSYINIRYNLSLMYEVAKDSEKYGWVKSWIFRIAFLIIGIGIMSNIANAIEIIKRLKTKKIA